MRTTLLLVVLLVATTRAQTCPEPTTAAVENRVCAFGSTAVYDNISTYINNITDCYTCAFTCGECTCGTNSVIDQAIAAGNYCGKSAYCANTKVELAMNFIVTGYETYETNFIRAQTKLIQLCGRLGNDCCNGACTYIQLEKPDSQCSQVLAIDPAPMRHWVDIFILIATINFIFTIPTPSDITIAT